MRLSPSAFPPGICLLMLDILCDSDIHGRSALRQRGPRSHSRGIRLRRRIPRLLCAWLLVRAWCRLTRRLSFHRPIHRFPRFPRPHKPKPSFPPLPTFISLPSIVLPPATISPLPPARKRRYLLGSSRCRCSPAPRRRNYRHVRCASEEATEQGIDVFCFWGTAC
jgi:hypothetical protein